MWKHSPTDWKVRHVKGHQDDLKICNDIDRCGTKGKISAEAFHQVHWDTIHYAMDESSHARGTLIVKHSTGMTGVGKFMK
jgi:hypothetical protein